MAKIKEVIKKSRALEGFKNVLTPRKVQSPPKTITLQEIKDRLPKDCQMHLMHTDGVGWHCILVDRTLGHVQGINDEADHEILKAIATALEVANAPKKSY